MEAIATKQTRLEHVVQTYRRIHQQKMQGLPLCNERLQVEAVGFVEWEQRPLGIIMTPWFINLTLLPGEQDDWSKLEPGSKQSHQLPEGEYPFIVGDIDGIGRYQACSLFTTVVDFPDQATARGIAENIMDTLLTVKEGPRSEPPSPQEAIRKSLDHPMSRRELLRRARFGGESSLPDNPE